MSQFSLKPTHAPVRAYYQALATFGKLRFDNKGNIPGALESLFNHYGNLLGRNTRPDAKGVTVWTLSGR